MRPPRSPQPPNASFTFLARVLAVAAVALAVSGCVSLTGVRTFSKISAETADYRAIVDDYADSARRYNVYRGPVVSPELKLNADQAQVNRANLLALQTTLCEYLGALGALADDRGEALGTAGDKLVDSMQATGLVAKAEVEAAKALATISLRLIAGGRQQRALRDVLGEANAPLQRVIAALQKFVAVEYPAQLDREIGAMRQMLSENIADNDRLQPQLEPVKGLARLLYDERMRELESRRERAQPYVAVLKTIAAGHQALYDSRDDLDTRNVSARMQTYAGDLKVLGKAVKR